MAGDREVDAEQRAAEVPEPPWRRARPGEARTPLTREAIVEAALRILDRDGLDAMSMRGVSEELGTGPASLYWHVTNKEELIDLVIDRIIGEVEPPTPSGRGWIEDVKEYGRRVRSVLNSHRDIARAFLGRIPTGPNAIVGAEWMLGILSGAGLPPRAVAFGSDAMFLYVNAFCYEEAAPFRAAGTEDPEEAMKRMREYFSSLPPERFPNFVAFADVMSEPNADERFDFGCEMMLRGLAAAIE